MVKVITFPPFPGAKIRPGEEDRIIARYQPVIDAVKWEGEVVVVIDTAGDYVRFVVDRVPNGASEIVVDVSTPEAMAELSGDDHSVWFIQHGDCTYLQPGYDQKENMVELPAETPLDVIAAKVHELIKLYR